MAIVEKVNQEDLALYELTRHPVLCGEFYRNLDMPDWVKETWEYTKYQKEYLGDFNHHVSLCCARAVGKTVTLVDLIVWMLINNLYDGEFILYTVPNKVHLEPVFFGLTRVFRNNPLLSHYIEPKKGINASNYTIKLLNTAELLCRLAGQSGTGANVVGLHTPIIILDEAGYYPWGTWVELQPVLNSWQDGSKLMVAGVPTGLRENNVLYFADDVDDTFSHHRNSAHDNPRYSSEDEERNVRQYGGLGGEDYIHLVLGQHGVPIYAVFDRRLMLIETYGVYKIVINGISESFSDIIGKLAIIPAVPKNDIVMMGIDLGYTEPTAIIIMYENNQKIKFHCRIELTKVEYPLQEKIIDYLDDKFERPSVIGIDAGNEQGLVQHLLQDDAYTHKKYEKRMYPVKFGTWLSLGTTTDGEEIKIKIKPYAVSLLQEYTNAQRIMYSTTDLDMIIEMERMTYTKNPTGEIVYRTLTQKGGKRGEDHFTSALLCIVIAYYLLVDGRLLTKKRPTLMKSRWIRGY